jgi:hypothetical protein
MVEKKIALERANQVLDVIIKQELIAPHYQADIPLPCPPPPLEAFLLKVSLIIACYNFSRKEKKKENKEPSLIFITFS